MTESGAGAKRLIYLATAVSALGGMLFGYDVGVIAGAILFIKKELGLSSGMEEVVVSSVLLGSLLGALVGGLLADRLGRRRLLLVTAVVFGAGALGAALAPTTGALIAARVIAGAAIGVASFVAPLYISEIAPVRIRGRLVSVNQVALTSGIVIADLVDYAFASAQAWRWMFALAVIPAAAFFYIGINNANLAAELIREACLTSPYVFLPQPIPVLAKQVVLRDYVAFHLRARPYVFDCKYEKPFETDVHFRVLEAFREHGIGSPAVLHRQI